MAEVTSALKTAIATACTELGWQNDPGAEVVKIKTQSNHGSIPYQTIADLRELYSCTSKEALRRSLLESGLVVELTQKEALALPVVTDMESIKYTPGLLFVKTSDELTTIESLKADTSVLIFEVGDDGEAKEVPAKILLEM